MSTNITKAHREAFDMIRTSDGVALFSVFVNGEPTSTIVAIWIDEVGNAEITPLFVAVTPSMVLTDHDGAEPAESPRHCAGCGETWPCTVETNRRAYGGEIAAQHHPKP